MDERPYLSIGDVLALLQREFPDVTISKIRFLESRGLLVPDRTPSGYRKFYEHDVERLRWILRQQREHFLPLKVIKGRLEGQEAPGTQALFEMGEPTTGSAAGREQGGRENPARGPQSHEREEAGASAAGAAPLSASGTAGGAEPDTPAGTSRFGQVKSGHNGLERSSGGTVLASVPARAVAGGTPDVSRQDGPLSSPAMSAGAAGSGPSHPGQSGDRLPMAPESRMETARSKRTDPAPQASAVGKKGSRAASGSPAAPGPAAAEGSASAPAGGAASSPRDMPGAITAGARQEVAPLVSGGRAHELAALAGVTLTAGELAQASGLEVAQVAELESFGLIEGRTVAGVRCYDEEALLVAGLAARFGRFGVEPRHLRVFKYAAERQTGLYSQIVLPLLRQRNPDARRRALEEVSQLSEIGASLQACLARAALRDLTGA